VHPLRVESVAWIVERKDVLAAFFGLLALLGYVRHVRRPGAGSYLVTTLLFVLGVMAKPVLVTWPLLMLVLDAWPLGRFRAAAAGEPPGWGRRRAAAARLLLEKAPWFALSAVAAVFTFVAQSKGGAVIAADEPPGARLLNVVWAYGAYLAQTLWPPDLAAYYPFVNWTLLSPPVLASALLLAALTWLAWSSARRRPWIAAGWCWYLISLVPMIGIVRVGGQSMADRYTYVPLIGPVAAVVWLAGEWARNARRQAAAAAAVVAATLVLGWMTRLQTAYWLSDTALFTRMGEVVPGNYAGYYGLGLVHHERRDAAAAERYYRLSIARNGLYYQPRIKLARLYLENERLDEAEVAFRQALALDPDDAMAQSVFGLLLHRRGKPAEAAEHLGEAVRLAPDLPEAHNNLGVVLSELGRTGEAATSFRRALALKPGFAEARANLEAVLSVEGAGAPGERGPHAP
jgi:tetratricopeptide (TPR) repeat protein